MQRAWALRRIGRVRLRPWLHGPRVRACGGGVPAQLQRARRVRRREVRLRRGIRRPRLRQGRLRRVPAPVLGPRHVLRRKVRVRPWFRWRGLRADRAVARVSGALLWPRLVRGRVLHLQARLRRAGLRARRPAATVHFQLLRPRRVRGGARLPLPPGLVGRCVRPLQRGNVGALRGQLLRPRRLPPRRLRLRRRLARSVTTIPLPPPPLMSHLLVRTSLGAPRPRAPTPSSLVATACGPCSDGRLTPP